ncbi:MAG: ATP-binding protein, partial [Cyanobacteria bacterium J06639_14]
MALNPDIRDQAYQFFIEEAPELLQSLEAELLTLSQDHNTTRIHSLMRTAHSIKGGAASVGLEAIATLSHRLENIFKALYSDVLQIDTDLESQLLQAYDCLRLPLTQQIETGQFDTAKALAVATPIFERIENRLGDALIETENYIPSSSDLGVDMVSSILQVDIAQGLERLAAVINNPHEYEVAGELRAQAEVFAGFAELLNLPNFEAIAKVTQQALDVNPDHALEIAELALEDFKRVRQQVLNNQQADTGTTREGPSLALARFANAEEPGVSSPTPSGLAEEALYAELFDVSVEAASNPSEEVDLFAEEFDLFVDLSEVPPEEGDRPSEVSVRDAALFDIPPEAADNHASGSSEEDLFAEEFDLFIDLLEGPPEAGDDPSGVVIDHPAAASDSHLTPSDAAASDIALEAESPATQVSAESNFAAEIADTPSTELSNHPSDVTELTSEVADNAVATSEPFVDAEADVETETQADTEGESQPQVEAEPIAQSTTTSDLVDAFAIAVENEPKPEFDADDPFSQLTDIFGGDFDLSAFEVGELEPDELEPDELEPDELEPDALDTEATEFSALESDEHAEHRDLVSDPSEPNQQESTQVEDPDTAAMLEFDLELPMLDSMEAVSSEFDLVDTPPSNTSNHETPKVDVRGVRAEDPRSTLASTQLDPLENVSEPLPTEVVEAIEDAYVHPRLDEEDYVVTFTSNDSDSVDAIADVEANTVAPDESTAGPMVHTPSDGPWSDEISAASHSLKKGESIEDIIHSIEHDFDELPGLESTADLDWQSIIAAPLATTADSSNLVPSEPREQSLAKATPSPPPTPSIPEPTLSPVNPGKTSLTSNFTVRVEAERLEQMSNLVGELAINRDGTSLQNEQLQGALRELLGQFSRFQERIDQLRNVSDQMLIAPERQRQSLTESSFDARANPWSTEFDSLEMDSYGTLHLQLQEIFEDVIQLEERVSDVNLFAKQSDHKLEQQQQMLIQLRDDLTWARMVPLSEILNRFPRMIRDLSINYQKPVNLNLVGANILVEKAILEKLYDPLLHLLRNAFDHGIEPPEVRLQDGKEEVGRIEVHAYHRGNQTIIEIIDDGQGLNLERIRDRAVERGWFTPEQVVSMPAEQLYELIFEPGFSTAQQVNELSGRGVGLDVVRAQLRDIRGKVSVRSTPGQGSVFTLYLPLTLTITKLITFLSGSIALAISADSVEEILTPRADEVRQLGTRRFLQWQESILPVYAIADLLSYNCPLPEKPPSQLLANVPLSPSDWGLPI